MVQYKWQIFTNCSWIHYPFSSWADNWSSISASVEVRYSRVCEFLTMECVGGNSIHHFQTWKINPCTCNPLLYFSRHWPKEWRGAGSEDLEEPATTRRGLSPWVATWVRGLLPAHSPFFLPICTVLQWTRNKTCAVPHNWGHLPTLTNTFSQLFSKVQSTMKVQMKIQESKRPFSSHTNSIFFHHLRNLPQVFLVFH